MSDESSMSFRHKIIQESFAFAIGLVVVLPFMIFFGVVLIVLQDIVLLEKMTALLGGLVALIIGYYFGQRPLRELSKQVKEAEVEIATKKQQFHGAKEDALSLSDDFDILKKELDEIRKLTEEVSK